MGKKKSTKKTKKSDFEETRREWTSQGFLGYSNVYQPKKK